jgi:hypothetical protein
MSVKKEHKEPKEEGIREHGPLPLPAATVTNADPGALAPV